VSTVTGPTGAIGLTGPTGATGAGSTGPTGATGPINNIYVISVFAPGVMANNQTLFYQKAVVSFTLPSGLTGSNFLSLAAATASTTITLKKNGSSIGTLVWSASGTVPSVTFSGTVAFAAGDTFEVYGPATADATLGDVSLTFDGSRP